MYCVQATKTVRTDDLAECSYQIPTFYLSVMSHTEAFTVAKMIMGLGNRYDVHLDRVCFSIADKHGNCRSFEYVEDHTGV